MLIPRRVLVGGWTNPFEKYAIVKLDHETPIFGVKIKKNMWNHHPGLILDLPHAAQHAEYNHQDCYFLRGIPIFSICNRTWVQDISKIKLCQVTNGKTKTMGKWKPSVTNKIEWTKVFFQKSKENHRSTRHDIPDCPKLTQPNQTIKPPQTYPTKWWFKHVQTHLKPNKNFRNRSKKSNSTELSRNHTP